MKMQIVYKPEAADVQTWVVDRSNPSWDLAYATEKATDWGWLQFIERIDGMSAIAWRALLWTLRKRDEPRLRLDWVEVDWSELDLRVPCPGCEAWISSQAEHECTFPEPEPEAEAEDAADDAEPKKAKKKAGAPDPEA